MNMKIGPREINVTPSLNVIFGVTLHQFFDLNTIYNKFFYITYIIQLIRDYK